jgi:glycosyltransferase involved in cell wall biosynthesis
VNGRQIRVLLISDTAAGSYGGVALCVSRLGTELALLGAEVEYVFGTDGGGGGRRAYLAGLPKPLRLYDPLVGAVRLRNVLAPIVDRFDVLHSHGSNAIFDTVIALQLLRRKRAIHHVATLHGTDRMVLRALLGEMRRRREAVGPKQLALVAHYALAAMKEHIAYGRVSALIARSEGVAAEAGSLFGIEATSIGPGTDFRALTPVIDNPRRQADAVRLWHG